MNFEAHITIPREYYIQAELPAQRYGFHMSNITDDEVMGPGPKAYCTKSSNNLEHLIGVMRSLEISLRITGIPVLRTKIEAILIDERFES